MKPADISNKGVHIKISDPDVFLSENEKALRRAWLLGQKPSNNPARDAPYEGIPFKDFVRYYKFMHSPENPVSFSNDDTDVMVPGMTERQYRNYKGPSTAQDRSPVAIVEQFEGSPLHREELMRGNPVEQGVTKKARVPLQKWRPSDIREWLTLNPEDASKEVANPKALEGITGKKIKNPDSMVETLEKAEAEAEATLSKEAEEARIASEQEHRIRLLKRSLGLHEDKDIPPDKLIALMLRAQNQRVAEIDTADEEETKAVNAKKNAHIQKDPFAKTSKENVVSPVAYQPKTKFIKVDKYSDSDQL